MTTLRRALREAEREFLFHQRGGGGAGRRPRREGFALGRLSWDGASPASALGLRGGPGADVAGSLPLEGASDAGLGSSGSEGDETAGKVVRMGRGAGGGPETPPPGRGEGARHGEGRDAGQFGGLSPDVLLRRLGAAGPSERGRGLSRSEEFPPMSLSWRRQAALDRMQVLFGPLGAFRGPPGTSRVALSAPSGAAAAEPPAAGVAAPDPPRDAGGGRGRGDVSPVARAPPTTTTGRVPSPASPQLAALLERMEAEADPAWASRSPRGGMR